MDEVAQLLQPRVQEAYIQERGAHSWDMWLHRWSGAKQNAILKDMINYWSAEPERVKAMIKREVLVGFNSDGKELRLKIPSKARLIHFYATLHTQEKQANRYFAFQKAVSRVLAPEVTLFDDVRVTVSSSMNQTAKGQWFSDAMDWAGAGAKPTVVERDGKSWDATMGKEHMDLQLTVMREMEPDFLDFVRSTAKCKVRFGGRSGPRAMLDDLSRLEYIMDYTTKSGHNDTSSRNSLINAIITASSLRRMGVKEARVIVIGDDMLMVLRDDIDVKALFVMEEECGIFPVGEKFSGEAITRVEFASDAFAPSTNGIIAIPKLGKLFAKLFSTTSRVRPKGVLNFRHSVAVGLQKLVGGAPIYKQFLELGYSADAKIISTGRWERRCDEVIEYGPEFEVWLCDRYGMTHSDIRELANFISQVGDGPAYFSHPLVERVIAVDIADPTDRN